ncbi:chorismate mutase [Candidatus Falkowbacteria bacterium]|nr:chorismate mutase [Candidatus Falkowbacteria bacterium]
MAGILRLAVSGSAGSFSEEAARWYLQREGQEGEIVFGIDPDGVFAALAEGRADLGIIPVVNSRGGLVIDAYVAMGKNLFTVVDHVVIEVQQCLLALPGTTKAAITQFASHPQAFAQCERYLLNNFPNIKHTPWSDTAEAAEDLKSGKLPLTTGVIASALAGKNNGLEILEKGIQDARPNLTTFLVVQQ